MDMEPYEKGLLIKLYRTMVRIRTCEESFVGPILQGEVRCPVHLYSGQEAIATGVCTALSKKDYVFGNHRSHGHYLAKGGAINELIAEIFCKNNGCSRGRGGSMHVIDSERGMMGSAPIVAGTIPLAVGAALASKIKGDKRVTISFFGDGAAGEGVLFESLNLASLMKLPIIFVCENNHYSTHMPIRECRVNQNIYQIAKPFCMPSYKVDGNDILRVYELTKKAVELCRKGQGPAFIEFLTYRLRGHVGADDNIQGMHIDIRSKEELDRWRKRDPIKRFRRLLVKNEVLTIKDFEKIDQEVNKEVTGAHAFAKRGPRPDKTELTKYVYK